MRDKFDDKLLSAKLDLVYKVPFYGAVMLSLKFVETELFPTLATNGSEIFYNKKYLESLPMKYWASALLHETIHATLLHIYRGANKDETLWNIAIDMYTNFDLLSLDYPVHSSWVQPPSWASGLSVEQIYNKLRNNDSSAAAWLQINKNRQMDLMNDVLPAVNKQSDFDVVENAINFAATEAQKEFGTLPNSVKRIISALRRPTLSWEQILREHVTSYARTKTSWAKRNRRYVDFYMPARYAPSIKSVLIAVDTSGSIKQDSLDEFFAEIKKIRKDVYIEKTTVVSCDTEVKNIAEFSAEDEIVYTPIGGGGTKFTPVFRFAEKTNEELIIYFTDGYGLVDKHYDIPTIWVLTTLSASLPFGKHVYMRSDHV